jgi:hypothetical protein
LKYIIVHADTSIEISSSDRKERQNSKKKRKSLTKVIATFLTLAQEKLASQQHQLLNAQAESMRQRDLHKDYYSLVEESIGNFVSFAVSCAGEKMEDRATARLRELQGHFLDDKTRLLNQLAQVNARLDRLHAQQYRVTKLQAWFISLVQKLAEGSYPEQEMNDFLANSGAESGVSATLGADLEDKRISLHSSQTPDSVWAATMWRLIDDQLQIGTEKELAKDCG